MSRTDRPSASCWRGHPVDTTTTAATPSAAIPATALGLPPSDPADVHHGVGLSPLHDPTALAEGRVLDEVAVEVDPRLLSARGFARGLQGPPGRCVLRVRPAAEPALEDRDEIVGPGHDPDGYGAPVPPIEHGDQLRERQGPAHRSMMPPIARAKPSTEARSSPSSRRSGPDPHSSDSAAPARRSTDRSAAGWDERDGFGLNVDLGPDHC